MGTVRTDVSGGKVTTVLQMHAIRPFLGRGTAISQLGEGRLAVGYTYLSAEGAFSSSMRLFTAVLVALLAVEQLCHQLGHCPVHAADSARHLARHHFRNVTHGSRCSRAVSRFGMKMFQGK
jgi:hypothetical protein